MNENEAVDYLQPQNRKYVRAREKIIFGVANGGQVIGYDLVASHLTYFFVNVFRVSPVYVSAMLFLESFWDALNDPLVGIIVDRTRTRFGKLRPYLRVTPFFISIVTILLFAGPLIVKDSSQTAPSKLIYVTLTYILWEFFYSIADVPFWGLSTAISPNPAEKSSAIAHARIISGIISAVNGIGMPIMIDIAKAPGSKLLMKNVYFAIALLAGTVGAGLFALSGFFVKERVVQNSQQPSFKECATMLVKNQPLRTLILRDVIGTLGSIGGVFGTYYYVDVLGSYSASLLIGIPGVITGYISYMLLPMLKKRYNNKQLVIFSPLFNSAVNALIFILSLGNYTKMSVMIPLLMINNGLGGFVNAINSVVPMEMFGETVDYSEWTTSQRSEGISFAIPTFVAKFSGAVSRSFGIMGLRLIGYQTSGSSAFVAQSERTKKSIWLMYFFSPIVLRLFNIIPMLKYDLVGEKRKRMYDELNERRRMKINQ